MERLRYSNELTIFLKCDGELGEPGEQLTFSGWIKTDGGERWEFSELLAPRYAALSEELFDEVAALAIEVVTRWAPPCDEPVRPEWAPNDDVASAICDGVDIGAIGFAICREEGGEIVYGN